MFNTKRKIGCSECEDREETLRVHSSIWKDKRAKIIAISSFLFFLGLLFEFILGLPILAIIFFSLTFALSGYSIVKEGLHALIFRRKVTINFLVSLAAVGSFLIGHLEEGAAVIFLFYIAEFLESYSSEKAKRSIASLMKLFPEVATVKKNGEELSVPVSQVKVNDVVIVRPGEKIPLDGIVVGGVSTVNQAPITGESLPVTKEVGDEVYAGTINYEGYLEIKVTKESDETLLSRIIKFVREAQKRKSPIERFVDRFSRYYTPLVVSLAMVVVVIPVLVLGGLLSEWIYRALILLVVACPCALAISTPVAMVSAITSAAKNGVLIKGSNYIEEISRARVFAFDKTGTLTEGRLEVSDIIPLDVEEKETVLALAASIEAFSEHPIAKAIIEKRKQERVKLLSVSKFRAFPGKGATGEIGGEKFYVGNMRMFRELGVIPSNSQIEKIESEGKTIIIVGNERKILGLIAVRDKIRNSVAEALAKLKNKGIKIVMLTGDNKGTAKAVSRELDVDEFCAELLPEEKVQIIQELASRYGHVVMVGDGVNDAPALAAANVGIAMGVIGSDIALETADVALMEDDLSKIPYLAELCRKTLKIVKENITASILVKGAFAILAILGLVSLWLAVAVGDMGLSLAVTLNAIRLSNVRAS